MLSATTLKEQRTIGEPEITDQAVSQTSLKLAAPELTWILSVGLLVWLLNYFHARHSSHFDSQLAADVPESQASRTSAHRGTIYFLS